VISIERWGDDRIKAEIPWGEGGKDAAKRIPGARPQWDKSVEPNKFLFWHYPLAMVTCRAFRSEFGNNLRIGPALAEWAWDARRTEEELEKLRAGGLAGLPIVRREAPTLWAALQTRPFQIAGARFIVEGKNVGLGDEPRLGKTYQALAAAVESEAESILIAAPKSAVRTVWARKIKELLGENAFVAQGEREDREEMIAAFHRQAGEGRRFLIINREMIRIRRTYQCPDGSPTPRGGFICAEHGVPETAARPGLKNGCHADHKHKTAEHPEYPQLFLHPFDMIILDESHNILAASKNQISASIPQIRLGAMRLPVKPGSIKLAMSGTMFRSKNIKAWGTLNWLRPDVFSSFWRFAEEQFGVEQTGWQGARIIGTKLKSEEFFQDTLRPYYLARTKAEVAPQLKPIEYAGTPPAGHPDGPVGVYLDMDEAQRRAYKQMERVGLATLSDGSRIMANGVLAEITRLKQFATSHGKMDRSGSFLPSAPSCKLEWVLEFLEERSAGDGKVVIASQFTKLVDWFEKEIRAAKWEVVTITGNSTDRQREHAQDVFMHGTPRIAIINMFAGGEAIDLSAADEMIFLDEPWTTDTIQQAENRIQNLAKTQQLTVYRLRAAGTIEEDIAAMTDEQRASLAAGRPEALKELLEARNSD
jgi:hypothetical protein